MSEDHEMDKMIKVGRRQRPSGSPRRRPPTPALSPALREEVGSPGKGPAGPRPPRCSYGCGPAPRCPSVGARLPSGSSPAALRCGAPETGQGKQEVQAGGFQGIWPWGIGVGRLRLQGAEPGLLGRWGAGVSASEQSLAAEATLLPRSVSRVRVRMLSWKQIWCVGCLCFEWWWRSWTDSGFLFLWRESVCELSISWWILLWPGWADFLKKLGKPLWDKVTIKQCFKDSLQVVYLVQSIGCHRFCMPS